MIEPMERADAPAVLALAAALDLFTPGELDVMDEMLAADVCGEDTSRRWLVARDGTDLAGVVMAAPDVMTDAGARVVNILFLAVDPGRRRAGLGHRLLDAAECEAAAGGVAIAVVETSSLAAMAPARALYRGAGYRIAGQLADYYADGDDKVIFMKRLTG